MIFPQMAWCSLRLGMRMIVDCQPLMNTYAHSFNFPLMARI